MMNYLKILVLPLLMAGVGQTAIAQVAGTPYIIGSRVDKIRIGIASGGGTDLPTYDAAPPNTWVKVTGPEYTALLSALSSSSIKGTPDVKFTGTYSAFPVNNTTTMNFAADAPVPASNYVVAYSFISTSTTAAIKLKLGTATTSGYAQYGPTLSMSGMPSGGTRVYFVLKTPSAASPAVATNVGTYDATNTSMGYVSASGSNRYVGGGDVSNPNFNTTIDYIPMQVIVTATQQW